MSDEHLQALPTGYRIEEYEIVRVLGAGGFGITYLAFDHQLDGAVALKEYFPAEIATRSDDMGLAAVTSKKRAVFTWGLDRFIAEARSLHRFRHPNIVRVHRYVETLRTAYIVMEYVEGESLEQILDARGRLSAGEWRRWLSPLLDGLAHVHEQGFLHRDIKPANIVVRREDRSPVLIDFGAARLAAQEKTQTQVLTPGYAPIEQYSSHGAQGPFTDVYSLAAVSYRVITGEPMPGAPDRVLDDQHRPLSGRIFGADAAWLAALDRGLALRPENRPQTVAAWQASLEPAADQEEPTSSDASDEQAEVRDIGVNGTARAEATPEGATVKERSAPEGLSGWVRAALYVSAALGSVAIVFNVAEYELLLAVQDGAFSTVDLAMAAADASDTRQLAIAGVQLVMTLFSYILVGTWIYRSNQNARQLGASGMVFTPGWSVGWYFVPVFNLWRPYQALKEIWKASQTAVGWKDSPTPALLKWWWGLWILSSMLGGRSLTMGASELHELIFVNWLSQLIEATDLVLTLVMARIVRNVSQVQAVRASALATSGNGPTAKD